MLFDQQRQAAAMLPNRGTIPMPFENYCDLQHMCLGHGRVPSISAYLFFDAFLHGFGSICSPCNRYSVSVGGFLHMRQQHLVQTSDKLLFVLVAKFKKKKKPI